MVYVVQEQVERCHALFHTGFDLLPVLRGHHAGDDVERQDTVDGVLLGVDGERDTEVEQLPLGVAGALSELDEIARLQGVPKRCELLAGLPLVRE